MADERTYPVRNSEVIAQMQAAYSTKLKRNQEAGQKAFETGDFKPYDGVSREFTRKPFYVMLELDNKTKQQIAERVVDPLEELTKKYKIPSIFTNRGDLPPHISLDVGYFNDFTSDQEEFVRNWMTSSFSHLNLLDPILTGLTFHMDTLIVAPNSFICSSQFNAEQGAPYKARRIIERAMRRVTAVAEDKLREDVDGNIAPPYRYDDILYVSIGRVTGKASVEALLGFTKEAYSTVGENLKSDPLPVVTSGVFKGRPIEFYEKYVPHLLKG